ncbi:MAG: zinc finger domain-containing protein, partial [Vicinamibacterales bacterium]
LAEFPSRQTVEALLDRTLTARWDRLIAVRDEVNRKLEAARQGKTIGNSLGARVSVRAGGATAALLEPYRNDLPMLFIVSQVALEIAPEPEDLLAIDVARAEGHKCARCWRIVDMISSAGDTDGLCERCVAAVAGPQAA